jgi:hypothetical protein
MDEIPKEDKIMRVEVIRCDSKSHMREYIIFGKYEKVTKKS